MSVVVIRTHRVRGWSDCHDPSELGIMGHISEKNNAGSFSLWEQIVDVKYALLEKSLRSMEGKVDECISLKT